MTGMTVSHAPLSTVSSSSTHPPSDSDAEDNELSPPAFLAYDSSSICNEGRVRPMISEAKPKRRTEHTKLNKQQTQDPPEESAAQHQRWKTLRISVWHAHSATVKRTTSAEWKTNKQICTIEGKQRQSQNQRRVHAPLRQISIKKQENVH